MKEKGSPSKPTTPKPQEGQDVIVPLTPLSYQKNNHLDMAQTNKFPTKEQLAELNGEEAVDESRVAQVASRPEDITESHQEVSNVLDR